MNSLFRIVFVVALVISLCYAGQAQIPNAGFESWGSATSPTSWVANNIPSVATTVSRSTDKHSGTYAAQGQVVSYLSNAFPPTLVSMQFPVSQRYMLFSGYYKFTPVHGDMVGAVVYMYKNGSLVGLGGGEDGTAYSSFTQVGIPIVYVDSTTVPDSAMIEILITADTVSGQVHVGSTFLVDDLTFGGATGVTELPGLPHQFRLDQNFPNPFNPSTRIAFSLPKESHVSLKVYNLAGEEVATLANEVRPAGNYAVDLNAAHLPSGVYFYKLVAGSFVRTNKMVLMK